MKATTSSQEISRIISGGHHDPFQVLGAHEVEIGGKGVIVIRAYLPEAKEAFVLDRQMLAQEYPMKKTHPEGFFEAVITHRERIFPYQLKTIDEAGQAQLFFDPYSFWPILSEYDLHLFAQGNHHRIYQALGAHLRTIEGIEGVHFAVWAPNALAVSVIGDFNNWDGRRHPMRVLGASGVWELFIPGLGQGMPYKYEIKTREGHRRIKADPYAFYAEMPPKSASLVYNIGGYSWHDQNWMETREKKNQLEKPLAIYEVHLGSWARVPEEGHRVLTYREMAHKLANYVGEMGFTHIELLPILLHPYDPSWGYQVSGYYAPTPKYGSPEELMCFVDVCHQHNIGVILDWVPSHFPRDDHALRFFDGTHLYEHADWRQAEHKEWGTLAFNFGRNEVRNFLVSNALFWLDNYHLDGLRTDAVASMLYLDYSREEGEWIPNRYGGRENLEAIDFLKRLNEVVYSYYPGVLMIAEESTAWPAVSRPTYLGGLGFGLKWNMGWMHDILEYMSKDPIYRKYHQNLLTFALLYAFHENFVLSLSHDEVVHGKGSLLGKMPGDFWQRFANLRLLLAYMYAHPGKKLLFMGSEIGQWSEWNHDHSLDWHLLQYEPHQKLQRLVKDLNQLYRSQPALYEIDFHPSGFEWIDFHDADNSVVSFLRRGKNPREIVVFVGNFTPVPRFGYRIGVPVAGFYKELLNSDSEFYWGSNLGNGPGVWAEEIPWQGRPYSLNLKLPPLSGTIFKPEGG